MSNGQTLGAKLEDAVVIGFGLAVFPLVALVSPRSAMGIYNEATRKSVDTPQNADYLASKRTSVPDEYEPLRTIRSDLAGLADAGEWQAISERITAWDKARAKTPRGVQLSAFAMDVLRGHLSVEVYPPNMCNFEAYYAIPDGALRKLELAVESALLDPMLNALLAQAHIDRGWLARSGGWSEEVTQEGWQALLASFETAAQILNRFDTREESSSLLAQVEFQLLAAMEGDIETAREMYRTWSDQDITAQGPHEAYAFYVTPRWFGTHATLEAEACLAAKRTASATGEAAYASFYLTALKYEELSDLHIDMERFGRGLNDLCALDATPARRALELAVQLHEEIDVLVPIWDEIFDRRAIALRADLKVALRNLLHSQVNVLPTKGEAEFEKEALDVLSSLFQDELKSGQFLHFSDSGIEMVTPER